MSKYNVTHTCGHTARYDLIGPRRSREWRLERLAEKLCDECWEADRRQRREQENAEATEVNRQMDLPALTGSEKQIPWAESIRRRRIQEIEQILSSTDYASLQKDPQLAAALDALYTQTAATWWINDRDMGSHILLLGLMRQAQMDGTRGAPVPEEQLAAQAQAAASAKAEATVCPAEAKTATVAEIRLSGDVITVIFPERRDDFRELIRFTLRFKWVQESWQRQIGPFAGTAEDRTAEVGHRLLAARFPVRLYDADLRTRAVAGDYEPEPRRWVKKMTAGQFAGWFVIRWPHAEDFYEAARRIKGSRYSDKGVYVPSEQYAEVLDFAERYEFRISPGAKELADEARQIRERALVVSVAIPKAAAQPPVPGRVPVRMEIPDEVGVNDDLRDD